MYSTKRICFIILLFAVTFLTGCENSHVIIYDNVEEVTIRQKLGTIDRKATEEEKWQIINWYNSIDVLQEVKKSTGFNWPLKIIIKLNSDMEICITSNLTEVIIMRNNKYYAVKQSDSLEYLINLSKNDSNNQDVDFPLEMNIIQILKSYITDDFKKLDDIQEIEKVIGIFKDAIFQEDKVEQIEGRGFVNLKLIGIDSEQEIRIVTKLDYFNSPMEKGYLIYSGQTWVLPNSDILSILRLFETDKYPGDDRLQLNFSNQTEVFNMTTDFCKLDNRVVEQINSNLEQAIYTNLWPESFTGGLDALLRYENGKNQKMISLHIEEVPFVITDNNEVYLLDMHSMLNILSLLEN